VVTGSAVDEGAVERAAERLAAGGLVAFPTETVYGLGARADDDIAVARIYAAKGRPPDHPLIVHVADLAAAGGFADTLGRHASTLLEAFWPGPLTVIVRRRRGAAEAASGGQPTIGLRCPAHPVARALLAAAARRGVPGIAAPSANRFGRVSPTRAEHVTAQFGPDLMVLDGGLCTVGVESTIVDLSGEAPVLLRPGGLRRDTIEAVLREPLQARHAGSPRASGTLAAHYAPVARVELLSAGELSARLAALPPGGGATEGLGVYSRSLPANPRVGHWRTMPDDPVLAARELFAVLHECDAADVRRLWVERVPDTPAWEAIGDRLSRAAASA
jgi:L-threonylcarbamoyladenylate synthase